MQVPEPELDRASDHDRASAVPSDLHPLPAPAPPLFLRGVDPNGPCKIFIHPEDNFDWDSEDYEVDECARFTPYMYWEEDGKFKIEYR